MFSNAKRTPASLLELLTEERKEIWMAFPPENISVSGVPAASE